MPDQGTGTTVVATTSGFQTGVTFIDFNFNMTRGSVDMTHMGSTGGMEYDPADLPDWGEVSFTCDLDSEQFNVTGGHLLAVGKETWTITFPDTETVAGTMFCTSISAQSQINQRMTATVTLKVSGALTFST